MKMTNIGIEKNQMAVVEVLNRLLADEFVLYTKTRNYHWNVTGPHFYHLHQFFESQYEALDEVIDDIAERARSLGGIAAGSLAEYSKLTRLREEVGQCHDSQYMVNNSLNDHEYLIRNLRSELEVCMSQHCDAATSDFLTGLMEKHEKMAWMLRASLDMK